MKKIDGAYFALVLDDAKPSDPVKLSRSFLHSDGTNRSVLVHVDKVSFAKENPLIMDLIAGFYVTFPDFYLPHKLFETSPNG